MTDAGRRLLVSHECGPDPIAFAALVRETGAAGVVLFARHCPDPMRTRELVAEIRGAVPRPLVVAIDQEEGKVVRLARGLDLLPGAAALGRIGSEELARRAGRVSAARMALIGIDLVLAPVVDRRGALDNPITGLRSFGNDPELVARLGRAYAAGLEEGGCAACAKHFPGLGPVEVDPHLDLPRVALGRDPAEDIGVFAALAPDVAAIMTTHLLHPDLDPETPVTFSASVVGGLLRRGLDFPGAILSDDLGMGGARHPAGLEGAVVAAARAGHDLVLCCEGADAARRAAQALGEALTAGRLDRAEHELALQRIAALARRRAGERLPATEDAAGLAAEIAGLALRVSGDRRRLPVAQRDRLRVLDLGGEAAAPTEEGAEEPGRLLTRLLAEEGLEDAVLLPGPEALPGLACDRLVVLVRDVGRRPGARELLRELLAGHPDRTILVLAGPPADRLAITDEVLVLDAAGGRRAQLRAAARAIAGAEDRSAK